MTTMSLGARAIRREQRVPAPARRPEGQAVSRETRTLRMLARWFLWVLPVWLLLPGAAIAQESLCAEVKIVIEQKLSLERQAFDAHMVINNGLDSSALQNLAVDLYFTDQNNEAVTVTTDANATGARFFMRTDSIAGLAALDGSASLPPKGVADIHWLIIPAAGAGGVDPKGKVYYVGARVRYTLNGQSSVVDVTPDYVVVRPQPLLRLDYFLPRDVYADDPFTPEVEPQEAFTLGVRVSNVGGGTALRTRIESAQPKIVENRQGLLIDFQILGGYVSDLPGGKSLLLDFGDIAPGRAKMGRWNMVTTLAGRFVEFSADYAHADSLGGAVTSLLQQIDTHTLLHDVRVDLPGRDGIRDFLARDGDVLRVYESDGVDSAVVDQSASAAWRAQGANHANQELTLQAVQGFVYVKLADPFLGKRALGQVLRSDGKTLPPENVWLSKTRNADLSWSYAINLFDANTTGAYSLGFVDTSTATLSGAVYKDVNANGLRDAGEPGIGALAVTLKGEDSAGVSVSSTAWADASGAFSFTRLNPGRYQIEAAPVDGLIDGAWLAGSAGGQASPGRIGNIQLAAGMNAQGYLLAKRAAASAARDKADLAIRLTATPLKLRKGDAATLQLTASNAGPAAASDVSVNLALPGGWQLQSAAANSGSYTAGVWRIGALPPGGSATLTVSARADSLADSTTIGAQIGAATEDPVPGNNSASVLLRKEGGDMLATQSLPNELRLLILTSCVDAQSRSDAACAENKAGFIQSYLTGKGHRSTALSTVAQLRKALRSGLHNGVWLNAAGLEMSELLLGEIREFVRRGNLLIVDGQPADRLNLLTSLHDVLGVTPGASVEGDPLEVQFNDGAPSVRLAKGTARALQVGGASELAHVVVAGKRLGVAAANGFARGKALTVGFDLLAGLQQAAQEAALGAFLGQQLTAMQPAERKPSLARTVLPVETVLENSGAALADTRLTTQLSAGMSLSDARPAPSSSAGQQSVWNVALAAAQTQRLRFMARLPAVSGAATLQSQAVLSSDNSVFGDFVQSIDVIGLDVLIPRVLAAVDALTGSDPAAIERIVRARALLREAQAAGAAEDHDKAIARLLEAQSLLQGLSLSGGDLLRQDIGDWLGVAEMSWRESGSPAPAARIVASAGAAQSTLVGTEFPALLQATVLDADGAGVPDVDVNFKLPAAGSSASFSGGLLSVTVKSDAGGLARSPKLAANAIPGAYAAEASVAGVTTTGGAARFPLENRAAPPVAARLEILAGTPQETPVGQLFAALKVKVLDKEGVALPGVAVTFLAPETGASARFLGVQASATARSDSAGIAASPILTANMTTGAYQVTASVDGLAQPAVFKLVNSENPDNLITLVPIAGAGQMTLINAAFAEPLVLQASNRRGQPRSGIAIRLALPASGASARFAGGQQEILVTTGADGLAHSPQLTANGQSGRYQLTASSEKSPAALKVELQNLTPGSDGKYFAGLTSTGTGAMFASISGGGAGCVFKAESTRLLADARLPGAFPKMRFPHGVFEYGLWGCVPGSKITISSTWPRIPGRLAYRKFGSTPASQGKPVGYLPDEVRVHGSTIDDSVFDGGLGDDDLLANGAIHSLGAPVLKPSGTPSPWLPWLLD